MTVEWNGATVLERVRKAAMRGVIRGTEDVRTEADSLMNESPRSGRVYTRRGVSHKASAPGEPPAPDTGRLRQSLRTEYNRELLMGTAIASTAYAQALEFGTSRIAPRPFMRPALANRKDEIEAGIADEIRNALR